jgi:hypothetical protein
MCEHECTFFSVFLFAFLLVTDIVKTDTPSRLSVRAASVPVLGGSKLWLDARLFSGTSNVLLQ